MDVEVVSRELIKPSSPTPNNLRHHKLSYLDQIQGRIYVSCIHFYAKESSTSNLEKCTTVKKSLSQALTIFYPLAGRLKNNSHIDCNDEGLLFVEAQAKCELKEILMNPNANTNNYLIPLQPDDDTKDLAAISQITFFQCGGLALSFALLHKLGDGISHIAFLRSWTAIARGDTDNIRIPRFCSATHFAAENRFGFEFGIVSKEVIVKKWFLFDASTIAALRAKYSDKKNGISATRTEALMAFIWSRFMAATQVIKKGDEKKLYPVFLSVNMRPRMNPPLSEMDFGNFLSLAIINAKYDEGSEIVSRIREAITSANVESYRKGDAHIKFMEQSRNWITEARLTFTSWCRFPTYEADFGWGKPVWVGQSNYFLKNMVVLADTKDGDGIEAWISLNQEDMAKFESDNQILQLHSGFRP